MAKDQGSIQIEPLNLGQLDEVAKIHREAFPESAITKLGQEAIRRYYLWLLDGPHDRVALGALVNGQLVGFILGGVFRGALQGYLRRNKFFLARQVLLQPWLLSNEIFRDRLRLGWRSLLRKRKPTSSSEPAGPTKVPKFGFLSYAVHPEHRGAAGLMLLYEAERIAREQKVSEITLTVHTDNHRLATMYERMGYRKTEENGVWRGSMLKTLSPTTTSKTTYGQ